MLPKVKPAKRTKTPEQALASLMRMAARAEKSSGDALRLMRNWGVDTADQKRVLQKLVAMKFIDDSRYAAAFVRDKLRFSGWGAYKIKAALRAKGIDAATIDEALGQADAECMNDRLTAMLERKRRNLKYSTPYELKTKLMRYGSSLGYDFETVAEAVARTLKTEESCEDF
ncbi:MAG: RecX family transcriptional regulator [Alistipes sp.]|nr:RecX family transcriptional regulator [Alistipes sp.]